MPEESEVTSPSPIIAYLVEQLDLVLPEADKARLARHADAVAQSTHHGDLHRAWHCAGWAVDLAERSATSHLGEVTHVLKEAHKLWKDSWFGAEFGIMKADGVGPGRDIEIQWVDDAAAIAASVGRESGWDTVPWENLLTELLAVGH
jgi:hypothetical protein